MIIKYIALFLEIKYKMINTTIFHQINGIWFGLVHWFEYRCFFLKLFAP